MIHMKISYNKLWHIIIDRKIKKKDLQEAAGLTAHAMLCLRHNQSVQVETLFKITKALDCKLDDIVEYID